MQPRAHVVERLGLAAPLEPPAAVDPASFVRVRDAPAAAASASDAIDLTVEESQIMSYFKRSSDARI